MKKIQILGTGCPKCNQLLENAREAATDMEVEIEKVSDINEITKMGVMLTPALAIDGQVKASGKLLNPQQIRELLDE